MPRGTVSRTIALALVAAPLLAAPAFAGPRGHGSQGEHRSATPPAGSLARAERAILGPRHAGDHSAQRKAARAFQRRLARMTSAQRRRFLARVRGRARAAQSAPASEVGRWESTFASPTYGINAALLPTGKVLVFGYATDTAGAKLDGGHAELWDPATSRWSRVDPPLVDGQPAAIYCSGMNFLPDGRLLVTGGNVRWPKAGQGWLGTKTVFVFDPYRETWSRWGDMRQGRWYPGQVTLPDGSTVVAGGYTDQEPGGLDTTDVELLRPDGSIELKGSASRRTALYPHLRTMPSGDVLLAGPGRGDSALLSTSTWRWRELGQPGTDRIGGNAILLPSGPDGTTRVMQIGGYPWLGETTDSGAHASTETIDVAEGSPTYRYDREQLSVNRAYGNTVQLPDGNMVAVGGGNGRYGNDGTYSVHGDGRARQVELWDRTTGRWRLGPAASEDRGYHSSAVLLPDARVFVTGDDRHPVPTSDTAQIYSPPYLFRGGERPRITGAPSAARWGTTFGVRASGDLSRAVLVAPGATTHGADMTQRHVELRIDRTVGGVGVDVVAPPSANVAPPGPYMLFVLDARGVPSVASWIRLGGDAPDAPRLEGTPTTTTPTTTPTTTTPTTTVPTTTTPTTTTPTTTTPTGPPGEGDTTPPQVSGVITTTTLGQLESEGRVRVRITVDGPADVRASALPSWLAAARSTTFTAAGTKTLSLPLRASARDYLARMSTLALQVNLRAWDDADNMGTAQVRRTLQR